MCFIEFAQYTVFQNGEAAAGAVGGRGHRVRADQRHHRRHPHQAEGQAMSQVQ